ncbi:MAG: hypothetical protein WBW31_02865, partial [Candidatus Sulfotelmatobacter sp.]
MTFAYANDLIIFVQEVPQMPDFTKSTFDFLQELRQERDELDTLIQSLEKRLGGAAAQSIGGSDGTDGASESVPRKGRVAGRTRDAAFVLPVTSMPVGFFHNLSQAAAAEKLLKMNPGQPYT